MTSSIQVFSNEEFGEIRTAGTTEEPLFCALDVASALGYANPAKAVITHCKGVSILGTPTKGGVQQIKFIKESEVYRLVLKSSAPKAEMFQDWVCNEVLPSIRKTGAYVQSVRSTFMELDGTLPLFLSHMDIAQAISGLDCLMALAKRQRKLLDEMDKTYNLVNKLDEKIERLTEEIKRLKEENKQLKEQLRFYEGRKKKVRTKKGGAS